MKSIIIDETVLIGRNLAIACTGFINAIVFIIVTFLYIILWFEYRANAVLGYYDSSPQMYQYFRGMFDPYLFLFPIIYFVCGMFFFLYYRYISVKIYFIYISSYLLLTLTLIIFVILIICLAHGDHHYSPFGRHISCLTPAQQVTAVLVQECPCPANVRSTKNDGEEAETGEVAEKSTEKKTPI